ncbi:MAG: FKBP-type peptidyl-prolyl cis-trans isomerase [Fibrobacterales bacterium]
MTQLENESYAVGTNVAESLVQTKLELDIPTLVQAITDVMSGGDVKLSPEEINTHLESFGKQIQEKQAEALNESSDVNLEKGVAFLEENKAKESVVVTESGLQYEVLEEGEGDKPSVESTVRVHYAGTTIDGAEFDSSYKRGEPAQFPVGGVIKGWTEALQLMSVGSKYRLTIPSDIAYGAQGAGQAIGPNETLCFDVELLAIV